MFCKLCNRTGLQNYYRVNAEQVNKKTGEETIVEKELDQVIVFVDEKGRTDETQDGIYYHGEKVSAIIPLDFSFTKNVLMMFIAVVILLIVFLSLAKSYKKTGVGAPKGLQGFLEPLVVFIEVLSILYLISYEHCVNLW